jgi:hypothetical protein
LKKILFVFTAGVLMLGLGFSDASSTETGNYNCEDEVIVIDDSHWQRYSWTGGPHEEDDPPDFPSDDWQANVEGDPHNIGVAGPYFRSHGGSGNGDWFYLEWVVESHEEPNPNYPCTTTTVPTTTVPDTTVPDTTVPTTTVPTTTVPTTTVPDTTVPPTTEVPPTVPPVSTEVPPVDTAPTCEDDPSQEGCEDVLAALADTGSDSGKHVGLAGLLLLAGSGAMLVSHNLKRKEA